MWMKSSWRSMELHVAADSCSRSVLISRLLAMMCTSKPTSLSLYLGSMFSTNGLGAGEASSSYGSGGGVGVLALVLGERVPLAVPDRLALRLAAQLVGLALVTLGAAEGAAGQHVGRVGLALRGGSPARALDTLVPAGGGGHVAESSARLVDELGVLDELGAPSGGRLDGRHHAVGVAVGAHARVAGAHVQQLHAVVHGAQHAEELLALAAACATEGAARHHELGVALALALGGPARALELVILAALLDQIGGGGLGGLSVVQSGHTGGLVFVGVVGGSGGGAGNNRGGRGHDSSAALTRARFARAHRLRAHGRVVVAAHLAPLAVDGGTLDGDAALGELGLCGRRGQLGGPIRGRGGARRRIRNRRHNRGRRIRGVVGGDRKRGVGNRGRGGLRLGRDHGRDGRCDLAVQLGLQLLLGRILLPRLLPGLPHLDLLLGLRLLLHSVLGLGLRRLALLDARVTRLEPVLRLILGLNLGNCGNALDRITTVLRPLVSIRNALRRRRVHRPLGRRGLLLSRRGLLGGSGFDRRVADSRGDVGSLGLTHDRARRSRERRFIVQLSEETGGACGQLLNVQVQVHVLGLLLEVLEIGRQGAVDPHRRTARSRVESLDHLLASPLRVVTALQGDGTIGGGVVNLLIRLVPASLSITVETHLHAGVRRWSLNIKHVDAVDLDLELPEPLAITALVRKGAAAEDARGAILGPRRQRLRSRQHHQLGSGTPQAIVIVNREAGASHRESDTVLLRCHCILRILLVGGDANALRGMPRKNRWQSQQQQQVAARHQQATGRPEHARSLF